MNQHLAFIGGGNMAIAMLGGLRQRGFDAEHVTVIEPDASARSRLQQRLGLRALAQPDATLQSAHMVVWAVKPQVMAQACAQARPFLADTPHLSIAAGVRSESLAQWLGNQRIVRAMPNTPALVGRGISGVCARSAATEADRHLADAVLSSFGEVLWLEDESQLDVITALSGSGPAYVFYFMEAMTTAGIEMGLTREQSQRLAVSTVVGAGALAAESGESPRVLRERVTSKGGTTAAALAVMEEEDLQATWINAIYAARERSQQLGQA